jgi:hypothetical protein
MKFIDNPICEFQILSNKHLLEDNSLKNVLSAVFFKRDEYYKNFGIYVKGIKKTIDFIDSKVNDFNGEHYNMILFIDSNIKNDEYIMKIINSSKRVLVVLFDCPSYKKDKYHIELFGTMVRFFPMFDFPNNPTNIVVCIDIDLHDDDYTRLISLMKHKPEGLVAAGTMELLFYKNKKAHIFAGTMSSNTKHKYDQNIIIDFIKTAHENKSPGFYKTRTTPFGFGIDEIFINEILIPIIHEYSIIIEYQISYFLFHSNEYIMEKKRIDNTNQIFKTILGKYYKDNMTTKDMLNFIDKSTYQIRTKTDVNEYLTKRYSNIIHFLAKNKKKWLQRNIIDFINTNLLNIIHCNIIVKTNDRAEMLGGYTVDEVYVNKTQ